MVRGRKSLVIFLLLLEIGVGGLFLKASALCGNYTGGCSNVDADFFGYPFPFIGYINGDCGYSGLTYSCSDSDSRRVMNISGNLYSVLMNHEGDRKIRVVGVDVEEEECPRPMHNFTLPTTSPFSDPYRYDNNQGFITYFYNCSSSSGYPKDVVQHLPCLDTYYNNRTTPGLRSFAFSSEYSYYYAGDRFNWYTRNCQESVVVPIRYMIGVNSLYPDLNSSIKAGFELKWSRPEECKDCEKSGGQCWFNHTTAHACSCPQHGIIYDRKLFDKVCPIQGLSIKLKIILGVCSGIGGLLLALFICRQKLLLLYGSIVSHWNSKIKSVGPKL